MAPAPGLEVQNMSEDHKRKRNPSAKSMKATEMLTLITKFPSILMRLLGKKLRRSMMPDLSGRSGSGWKRLGEEN